MMLRHNVDQFMLRDGQVFIYGWGFVPGEVVTRVSLRLEFDTGSTVAIDVEYGRQRDDVTILFPGIHAAENSGFLLLAGLGAQRMKRAALRWEMAGQPDIETVLSLPESAENTVTMSKFSHYKMLLRKAAVLLRSAGARVLIRKIGRYFSNQPRSASEEEWRNLRATLAGRVISVIVDHDMGGGANIYRDKVIAERCAEGESVLLLGFHVASLQYFIEVFADTSSRRYPVSSPDALLALSAVGKLRQIIYNCAVSFRTPLHVVDTLITLHRQSSAPVLFLVHDYFVICPSHFLLDADGVFCGVPEIRICDTCLVAHRDGFVSLSGIRDVEVWRAKWFTLLALADEIRVFSESSKTMLQRAYPALGAASVRVVPHALHTQLPVLHTEAGNILHIGVVGAIGRHKGAQIVAELATEIGRRGAAVKITVIGTLEAKVPREIVTVTGTYAPENLPVMIAQSGANVFLFPSIWGETFSYTSHELIAMGLPFACFDFGAQADAARRYQKGLVLNSMNGPEILDRLEAFWRTTYHVRESSS